MRFAPVKNAEQQAVLMLHKTRDLLVRQRTMLINALRAHLAKYGIIASKGPGGIKALMKVLHETQGGLPKHARPGRRSIASWHSFEHLQVRLTGWRGRF
jgi:transposase